MEGNKTFKPDQEILGQLESDDENTNLLVIEKLRIKGKSGYLPYLIMLARTTNHSTVRHAIFNLLDDIKDKGAIPFIIEAIRDEKNKYILKNLVESCWQNGLDFSQFLPIFTDLLIGGSEEVSFEAFTVVENMELLPGEEIIRKEVLKIENHMEVASEARKYFLKEAIKILTLVTE
jgi:hypothetical protein